MTLNDIYTELNTPELCYNCYNRLYR